jgi:hypothetical protein
MSGHQGAGYRLSRFYFMCFVARIGTDTAQGRLKHRHNPPAFDQNVEEFYPLLSLPLKSDKGLPEAEYQQALARCSGAVRSFQG